MIDMQIQSRRRRRQIAAAIQATGRQLFRRGEQGALYLPQPQYLYTDSTLTTQVSDPGDPVGGMEDLSGNGNHATQSTDADRPIYGIVPATGRRNLLEWTEEFDNAVWTEVDATVSQQGSRDGRPVWRVQSTDSDNSAVRIVQAVAGTGQSTWTVIAKAGPGEIISGDIRGDSNITWAFNVDTGDFTTSSVGSNASIPTEIHETSPLEDGYWKLVFTLPDAGVWTDAFIFANRQSSGTDQYTDWNLIQVEEGDTPHEYQRVRSEFEVTEAGVPSRHYLSRNGTNQEIEAQLPNMGSTCSIALQDEDGFSLQTGQTISGPMNIAASSSQIFAWLATDYEIDGAESDRLQKYFESLGLNS